MKMYSVTRLQWLLLVGLVSACGGGGGQAPESFARFTSASFALPEDSPPVPVDNIRFIFDVNDDEEVFETLVMGNEFSL